MTFTNEQKHKAIERELKYRRYVYPIRVGAHKMSQQKADYEIEIFEAILADYATKAEGERLL